jgi:hypothetical protein
MDIHQDRTQAIQEEIITKMDAQQERMEVSINAWQEAVEACLVKAKANPEEMKTGEEDRPGRTGGCGGCLRRKVGQNDTADLKENPEEIRVQVGA